MRELRAFRTAKSWRSAEIMGTHSLRRGGETRAIIEAGGSFARLLRSGHWRFSAFQLHLDLGKEGSRVMASMLIDASDDEN